MSCFDAFDECSGLSDSSTMSSISSEVFLGNWKIVECINISKCKNSPPAKIEGAVFTLQDNGEIRWDLTAGKSQHLTTPSSASFDAPEIDESFPLFHCDCYEIVHSFVGISIQMGQISGHMFEFWIDRPIPRDTLLLTFEGWIMLQCQQVKKSIYTPMDAPFSLLPAFTEGFFSDLALSTKSSGATLLSKEFKIHSVIMSLTDGRCCCTEELSSLPADVLETALYFLYSLSLPPALNKETVARCIQLAPPSMTDFVQMCKKYLHRILLKRKILKLVNEVHSCAETMSTSFHEDTVTNPSRFCAVIKTILRHGAVAFIKLVELCVLYGEEASNLERNERLEILRYAKTRLPIFLTQFVALLRNIKNDFATVRSAERNDIATAITPEIENLLDLLSNLMKETKDACNDIWVRWSKECSALGVGFSGGAGAGCIGAAGEYGPGFGSVGVGYTTCGYGYMCWQDCQPLLETFPYTNSTSNSNCGSTASASSGNSSSSPNASTDLGGGPTDTLVDSLYNIFRKREIMKLHSVQGQVAAIYLYLSQKRENFEEMTTAVKVRCVARNLEQLLEELPIFLLRLEEIMIAFDDRFQWKDFKFCLQLAISQVYQTVQHLVKERDRLQKFFLCLVDLVQRDEFYQSLINLKLLKGTTGAGSGQPGEEKAKSNVNAETQTQPQGSGSDNANAEAVETKIMDTPAPTLAIHQPQPQPPESLSETEDVSLLQVQDQSIEREELALLSSPIPESQSPRPRAASPFPGGSAVAAATSTPKRERKDKFGVGDGAFLFNNSKFEGHHGHFGMHAHAHSRYHCMHGHGHGGGGGGGFCDGEECCVDELKLLDDLCTPRRAKDSCLAKNCAKLCGISDEFSDMVFEIPQDDEKESLEIPAHRVIMAARCDWFRRALLSGMRESIQKRIVIHDCSPQIFQLFLTYVYSGKLGNEENSGTGTTTTTTAANATGNVVLVLDTLSDLIALADRYEMDSLKTTCEQELVHKHLDENSVIFLLSLADQYNARTLRGACMEYIATNPDIMAKDLFEQLSPELQMEVYDITMWSKPKICLI